MTMNPELPEPAGRPAGRLGRALIRMFMKPARVAATEEIAEGLRMLTLESPAFRGLDWVPGQKVQIAMGSAFVARTFTPIDWDAAEGRTRLLGYMHGGGPGSAWVRDAAPGDACDVFGPRASLDLRAAGGACVLVGDETSIGLACALGRRTPGGSVVCLFEADRTAAVRDAVGRLGLEGVELFGRTPDAAHLEAMARRLTALAAADTTFVLTGNSSSLQHLRRVLKAEGVPGARLMSKPYWAPGKAGLD